MPVSTTLPASDVSMVMGGCTPDAAEDIPETTSMSSRLPSRRTKTDARSAAATSRARSAIIWSASTRLTPPDSEPVISAVACSHSSRRAPSSYRRAFSMTTPAAAASATTMASSCSVKSACPAFSLR
jgi:hypothetical protein